MCPQQELNQKSVNPGQYNPPENLIEIKTEEQKKIYQNPQLTQLSCQLHTLTGIDGPAEANGHNGMFTPS